MKLSTDFVKFDKEFNREIKLTARQKKYWRAKYREAVRDNKPLTIRLTNPETGKKKIYSLNIDKTVADIFTKTVNLGYQPLTVKAVNLFNVAQSPIGYAKRIFKNYNPEYIDLRNKQAVLNLINSIDTLPDSEYKTALLNRLNQLSVNEICDILSQINSMNLQGIIYQLFDSNNTVERFSTDEELKTLLDAFNIPYEVNDGEINLDYEYMDDNKYDYNIDGTDVKINKGLSALAIEKAFKKFID